MIRYMDTTNSRPPTKLYRVTYVLGTSGRSQSEPSAVLSDVKTLLGKLCAKGAKASIETTSNGGEYWSRMSAEELL